MSSLTERITETRRQEETRVRAELDKNRSEENFQKSLAKLRRQEKSRNHPEIKRMSDEILQITGIMQMLNEIKDAVRKEGFPKSNVILSNDHSSIRLVWGNSYKLQRDHNGEIKIDSDRGFLNLSEFYNEDYNLITVSFYEPTIIIRGSENYKTSISRNNFSNRTFIEDALFECYNHPFHSQAHHSRYDPPVPPPSEGGWS